MIRSALKSRCELHANVEKRFLDLYFDYCRDSVTPEEWQRGSKDTHYARFQNPNMVFAALLPMPQVHIYVTDTLRAPWQYVLERLFKVDFAFWTGNEIVAVEIDGLSHVGSADHIVKDRLLNAAGVRAVTLPAPPSTPTWPTCYLANVRLHDLRHTIAIRRRRAGVDLYTVKELLRHSSTRMAERYQHVTRGDLRAAVEQGNGGSTSTPTGTTMEAIV